MAARPSVSSKPLPKELRRSHELLDHMSLRAGATHLTVNAKAEGIKALPRAIGAALRTASTGS